MNLESICTKLKNFKRQLEDEEGVIVHLRFETTYFEYYLDKVNYSKVELTLYPKHDTVFEED